MDNHRISGEPRARCCPCHGAAEDEGITRRRFLEGVGGAVLGGVTLAGLSWASLSAAQPEWEPAPARRALSVKPVFIYGIPKRREQASWRSWGGIQTQEDADQEMARIQEELSNLENAADFPVKFLPIASARSADGLAEAGDVQSADALLVYAAGGNLGPLRDLDKDAVFFLRHKSGPVYLHYEIISPRFLRQHTDQQAIDGKDVDDVVVDSQEELLWRLRALCGLRNTIGSRIVAVGGAGAWAHSYEAISAAVQDRWKLDVQTFPYEELGKLIQAARQDKATVQLARKRAEEYVKAPGVALETDRIFVDNAFLLQHVLRRIMVQAGCRAVTIKGCMGTIMRIAETTACLALSLLNDDGYQAFCESDFVVIPSGILLGSISGRPTFLNDPTYPHDGIITLAHCTAPRRMDGKQREPARILTHFESDYGAAPKVEMRKGQKVTNIAPDFAAERWVGLLGEIVDNPFLPICRSQIDMRFDVPSRVVAERMPGFHWMTVYGDYLREVGYALKKTGIQWDCLENSAPGQRSAS